MRLEKTAVLIGVDGGGTRLRAVVTDGEGVELGRAEVPAAPVLAGLPGPVVAALADLVAKARGAAGVKSPVVALWAGMAGAGREAVRAELEGALARAGVAERVRVGTDAEAAFQDAFGDGPGVLLLAGTGSIACGCAQDGRQSRVGGWGFLLGDEGSGCAIGLEAMKWVARSDDGRAPATQLRERLLAHLGLGAADELIPWASAATRAAIAGLVPLVAATAEAGDGAAREILASAVTELEAHVLTLLERLGPWGSPPTVALGGGLLRQGGPLREAMARVLERDRLPVLDRELDAARGAAWKAAEI